MAEENNKKRSAEQDHFEQYLEDQKAAAEENMDVTIVANKDNADREINQCKAAKRYIKEHALPCFRDKRAYYKLKAEKTLRALDKKIEMKSSYSNKLKNLMEVTPPFEVILKIQEEQEIEPSDEEYHELGHEAYNPEESEDDGNW